MQSGAIGYHRFVRNVGPRTVDQVDVGSPLFAAIRTNMLAGTAGICPSLIKFARHSAQICDSQ